MAFSGGTFSRTFDCTTDRDNGVKILASKFDTELDGMATGLSTCILKDGTQTCTAAIPFAQGITLPDNKTIILGTNSDVTIQYDETTNDSLEIAANVEGAALGIVLKADQGDDAGDEWKLNIADGGTLTLGNDIASAGSYVTHLTITPNSTVSNSTTAVAGNLTVGGDLTLGSGAVITEAELEMLDGITAGTVSASKAMVVDANKDITGGRNLTISGELDAGSLDISGSVDIDGTLETDGFSIEGTAVTATGAELNYSDTGAAVGTVVASKVVTADANKDVASFRNITLTGELDAGSLDVSGDADIDGTLEADAMTLNGTAITATATLDTGISNNNVPKFTSGVADDDFLRVAGTAIEGRSAAEVLSDIGASAVAGSSSIVTTGALNAGSITSGFGSIDNGSSAITTTGVITGGTLEATTDTAAGDNAAIGYTAAEGLILTGQGSTSDITLKNDADATVFTVPTGTDDILFPDSAKAMFGAGSDLQIYHDGSNSYISDQGTNDLKVLATDFQLKNAADNEFMMTAVTDGAVTMYHNNAAKIATTSSGVDVTGTVTSDGLTVDGDVTLNDGSPNLRLQDSDVSRFVDILYGTRVATFRNTMASGEDIDTVEPSMVFSFKDDSETRTAMTIDHDGQVGIGTASPPDNLSVVTSGSNAQLSVDRSDGASGRTVLIHSSTGGQLQTTGSVPLTFGTADTERMRIDASGKLLIGTTSELFSQGVLQVKGNGAQNIARFGAGANAESIIFENASGTAVGSIQVNASATAFNTSSDYRLKKEVTYNWDATTRLKELKPARFKWIADGDDAEFVDGFIAHELTAVPDAISGKGKDAVDDDGNPVLQGVDQSKIVPLLVKTIQELEARITALEAG